ncbi:uncharacterized protein BO80DRAFT_217112 [Aspergillus ibericus CBS 121593]|uniref:Rhodopsin domain-containing protein n=1 Tax=Aspergillus ibericus CBS 121593 TaxID=1448316 RepID=A0A395GME4_9EURO|nr:hypothetical protein BO80DRAFT_217112 [Aspergillus ibericus CBS 121593]RAK96680.1 hypothetical protein BO80DRAFT_217112 [Aspergillus ibericus CBS 121593]
MSGASLRHRQACGGYNILHSHFIAGLATENGKVEISLLWSLIVMSTLSPEQRQALLDGPAGTPPPGQASNLIEPPNLLVAGRTVLFLFWTLASVSVAIRIYTKVFLLGLMRLSDYTILLAWALFMGYFGPAWALSAAAPGVDQWNLRLKDFIAMLYYFHVNSILYGICIFFIKLSIFLQLLEIFGQTRDYVYWSCHICIWANFLFYFISTFVEIFSCHPMSKAWDVLITEGSCLNMDLLNVIAGAVNSVSDLTIVILPQTRIWQLHVALDRRIAVGTVFLFGVTACVASVVRVVHTVLLLDATNNTSYFSYLAGMWTLPELACGIIAGCLPSMPKFFRSVWQSSTVAKWRHWLRRLLSIRTRSQQAKDLEAPARLVHPKGHWVSPEPYPLTSIGSRASTAQDSTSSTVNGPDCV